MALPQFQADPNNVDTVLSMMQNAWAALLNPFISRPQNQSTIIPNVSLSVGANTITHGLGGPLTGWSIVRINGVANVYDQQAANANASKTLVLVSDAAVTVSLEVF